MIKGVLANGGTALVECKDRRQKPRISVVGLLPPRRGWWPRTLTAAVSKRAAREGLTFDAYMNRLVSADLAADPSAAAPVVA